MNQLNYRHNINSNTPSRAAIRKGQARKKAIKGVYSALFAIFIMVGITTVFIACNYIGLKTISYPYSCIPVFGGLIFILIGFGFGIKGFQR